MSDTLLREELVKLAHANPELRAHLLPLLQSKEAAGNPKVTKVKGELTQVPGGDTSIRVGLMSGGAAAATWKKFQNAYNQRKLAVTFDDAGITFAIVKGGAAAEGEGGAAE